MPGLDLRSARSSPRTTAYRSSPSTRCSNISCSNHLRTGDNGSFLTIDPTTAEHIAMEVGRMANEAEQQGRFARSGLHRRPYDRPSGAWFMQRHPGWPYCHIKNSGPGSTSKLSDR